MPELVISFTIIFFLGMMFYALFLFSSKDL